MRPMKIHAFSKAATALLLLLVVVMLLRIPLNYEHSKSDFQSGCEDRSLAPDHALNARLQPFETMPENVGDALSAILKKRSNSRATFVQIGANNGVMFDPLYPHIKTKKSAWIGLQVEPQPVLFSSLAVLHADAPDWAFYHGALVSPKLCINGTLPFCETKTPGEGTWLTQGQLNSVFERDSTIGCNPRFMHTKLRPCVTSFDQLIGNHASPVFLKHALHKSKLSNSRFNIDFLQIDVEGKDYEVLKMINWDTLYPQCIHYEHSHLDKLTDEPSARQDLEEKGYTLVKGEYDVLACLIVTKSKNAT
eukprot:CAMPEP_0113550868 /NCGR_PEP_ID=MMETSP0015_2-20120614/14215_1 /TAXON_ID=2838 /ORGANISM="Odontella" /LENGTH=305 /DNA_ID=CAMNT_0000451711 /DNA_START=134 /DNA_END=1051 /DNA_ORIENTATION=+ /assembly_acc=CAM_ASM_000160